MIPLLGALPQLLGHVVRANAGDDQPLFSYAGELFAGSLYPAKEASAS
ncbi:hypothetical protein [Streptomyces zhihengii]